MLRSFVTHPRPKVSAQDAVEIRRTERSEGQALLARVSTSSSRASIFKKRNCRQQPPSHISSSQQPGCGQAPCIGTTPRLRVQLPRLGGLCGCYLQVRTLWPWVLQFWTWMIDTLYRTSELDRDILIPAWCLDGTDFGIPRPRGTRGVAPMAWQEKLISCSGRMTALAATFRLL
jgi:hypothetical protein